jgi:UDP-2,3-diacylglucosamine pyrophosphatase LpxH
MQKSNQPKSKIRSLFLSDLHLGAPHAHARELADFLESIECEKIYLVGDIVDLWWVSKRKACWGRSETRVLEILRQLNRRGVSITYLPGNHDAPMRAVGGEYLAGIKVQRRAVHQLPDGRSLLVTHGDQFDRDVRFSRLQKALGAQIYDTMLSLDATANAVRAWFGWRRFSLAGWIKRRNGKANEYVARYEQAAMNHAVNSGLDGIICGHIHQPRLQETNGKVYANCGDWVENLTAIAEDMDGQLLQMAWQNGFVVTVSAAMPASIQLAPLRLAA